MNFLDNLNYKELTKNISLSGMTDEFFCLYISKLSKETARNIVIVTPTLFEANKLVNSLSNYDDSVLLFPMDDFLASASIATSPELKITRLETINHLISNDRNIIVTHLNSYLRYLPSKKEYVNNILHIKTGDVFERDELISKLLNIGYVRETTVTRTGDVGIRGFVIDIFPLGYHDAVRLEFFGDEIESIRIFDTNTQKSIESIEEVTIYPNTEFFGDIENDLNKKFNIINNPENISNYLNDPITVVKDYSQLEASYLKLIEDIHDYLSRNNQVSRNLMFSLDKIPDGCILYNTFASDSVKFKNNKKLKFDVSTIDSFHENIDVIKEYIKINLSGGKTIVICLKDYQIKSFLKFVDIEHEFIKEGQILLNKLNISSIPLNQGFIYENYIFLTEKELFNKSTNKNKYKTTFKYSSKIKNINNLNIGDYVVHNVHGIGVYNGIKTLSKGGLKKDYLELLYDGKDKLYIPVEKIELINKYTGKEGMIPKVHKLGGTEWAKTKLRVRNKVREIAADLIKLYASREMQEGYAFSIDGELQSLFEDEFQHDLTVDQRIAVNQIKSDMENKHPMDRLLCGDVGYGKTEVAFRAMFKAVSDSKQVLYLCPTTILSNQQYNNALARFKNFPVNIAVLNRFTTPKRAKEILKDLEEGKLDILFGTHRILSNDIKPSNLGLLIIDEEQRFGVVHKEKIKQYKNNVDVLTLTATPIPRTLQMSMMGIRSLSLIETPPVNRYPVETYVIEENDLLIKDAIYKELSRNGQVFFLYNSVEKIEAKAREISNLVPDARVVFAHGRMNKEELEDIMLRFINHDFDVLICTTIIETGIDIPNVNTLIIIDADKFGLSQLYQIRGRVGRSDKIAYAYLMYNKNKILTETAMKRLKVIKEFTELGSGFSIATRDLSIRGAGDILGSEQAGFIDNVGIDLYMKILNDEINRLKGEPVEEEQTVDTKPLIEVETHIDDKYVEENELKIEIHKKINEIDSYEKLLQVKEELEDRFGRLSETLIVYMYEEWFEKLAKINHVESVRETKNFVEIIFDVENSSRVDGEKLFEDAYKISNMFRFMFKNNRLIIVLDTLKLEKHYLYYLVDLLKEIKFSDKA
ncbi:MAG: transcription-repair coupling factor [Bacilli bacterium]|nr:transcription-repair coupling factor [Bacilli bacterium]